MDQMQAEMKMKVRAPTITPNQLVFALSAKWFLAAVEAHTRSLAKRNPGQGDLAPNSVVPQTKLGTEGRNAGRKIM
jgi:hypothetical protein